MSKFSHEQEQVLLKFIDMPANADRNIALNEAAKGWGFNITQLRNKVSALKFQLKHGLRAKPATNPDVQNGIYVDVTNRTLRGPMDKVSVLMVNGEVNVTW